MGEAYFKMAYFLSRACRLKIILNLPKMAYFDVWRIYFEFKSWRLEVDFLTLKVFLGLWHSILSLPTPTLILCDLNVGLL